uniref:Uncharacterized protein n=1 Tax=Branchiostoma floridae TaxID=7739 RepID=C4A0C6_BRAFL|eukprot:XP_002585742.1 hypothetical protein BRAFLDRAFT_111268 [Branchiostoma floridae]
MQPQVLLKKLLPRASESADHALVKTSRVQTYLSQVLWRGESGEATGQDALGFVITNPHTGGPGHMIAPYWTEQQWSSTPPGQPSLGSLCSPPQPEEGDRKCLLRSRSIITGNRMQLKGHILQLPNHRHSKTAMTVQMENKRVADSPVPHKLYARLERDAKCRDSHTPRKAKDAFSNRAAPKIYSQDRALDHLAEHNYQGPVLGALRR